MSEKKMWIGIAAGTFLVGAGIGTLIYFKQDDIEQARLATANLETNIDTARATIEESPSLEHQVIVLREISTVIDQVLPSTEDLNNLIDDFYQYATDSEVRSTSFKRKPDRGSAKGSAKAFEKVGYTLTLEGGVFEFLDFMNRIETHSRFMAVPSFKVTSASRQALERDGQALHKIQVEVETYTYTTKGTANAVRIEGYSRKRDLLAGEISRRKKALTLSRFHYRGDRGRRDPWIDPRVPAAGDGTGGPTVQEQVSKIEELIAMMQEAEAKWLEVQRAENVLDRMVKKDELTQLLGTLDEELRRIESDAWISYIPAVKRMQTEVYEPRTALQVAIDMEPGTPGPRRAEMEQLIQSMATHIDEGEYQLALQAYTIMEPLLDEVEGDPVREALAEELRLLSVEAETVRDFENVELDFGGSIIIGERPPVILINGLSYQVGDVVVPGLEIAAIRKDEVDFYFRGFVLTRVY